MKRGVCVVYGGRSGEHEVSVTSAASVISALDKSRYDVRTVVITKSGAWISDISCDEYRQNYLKPDAWAEFDIDRGFHPEMLRPRDPSSAPDVIIPVLHGPFGEDGTMQGLLEMADLPYVGSGVLGSAIAMDKAITKHICRAHGIPVVRFLELLRPEWDSRQSSVIERTGRELGCPCFVKPANLGSSVGITKAHNDTELVNAIDLAFRYDRKILIEQAVDCREIEVSVLGNDSPEVSVAGEIIPCNEFYDYEAKYIDDRSDLIIPADITGEQLAEIQQIALKAFRALGCFGMARADFLIDKE